MQRDMKTSGRAMGWLFYGKHYGSYVTGLYLFTKVRTIRAQGPACPAHLGSFLFDVSTKVYNKSSF